MESLQIAGEVDYGGFFLFPMCLFRGDLEPEYVICDSAYVSGALGRLHHPVAGWGAGVGPVASPATWGVRSSLWPSLTTPPSLCPPPSSLHASLLPFLPSIIMKLSLIIRLHCLVFGNWVV